MEVSITGELMERLIRLHQSLINHQKEIKVIERKLDNPQVPDGKKDKLIYRYFVIQDKVIPQTNKALYNPLLLFF